MIDQIYADGWLHYLRSRLADDAQMEHRALALSILCIFAEEFPKVAEAAADYLEGK